MTSNQEIQKIISFFKKYKRLKDLILYSCTSDYPADSNNICLFEIQKLKKNTLILLIQ